MRNLWNWLSGWATTITIRVRYPDLFALLCDDEFDEDDYTEVDEP